MSRVEDIRNELARETGEYEYWDEALHLIAIPKRGHTLEITHLEVMESHRGDELATDGLTALEDVATEDGYDYLQASVGATNEPDDGSQPAATDPTALCLRDCGFREVSCRKSPRGDSEWGFSGYKPLQNDTG